MLPIQQANDNDLRQTRKPGSVSVRLAKRPTGARGGFDLVARCVDPETGRVDTIRLASWISDAALRDLNRAARAYSAVEAQLLAVSPGDVARFNQDLVEGLRAAASASRTERLRHENPVLVARWHPSPLAEGIATSGLRALLAHHGLEDRLDPGPASPLSSPLS